MSFSSWLRNWKGSVKRRTPLNKIRRRRHAAGRFARRLFVEELEVRTLMSAVTILGDDLITSSGFQEQYQISGFLGLGTGNRSISLGPGTYSVATTGGTFGTFTVSSQEAVTCATGALVATGNNVDFNLSQLAAVTIDDNLVTFERVSRVGRRGRLRQHPLRLDHAGGHGLPARRHLYAQQPGRQLRNVHGFRKRLGLPGGDRCNRRVGGHGQQHHY